VLVRSMRSSRSVLSIDGDFLPLAVEVAVAGNLTVCVCRFEDAVDGVVF
jgi:hypothetical protein